MKRITLLLACLLCMASFAFAELSQKQINRLISRYDVPEQVMSVSDPSEFWQLVRGYNRDYTKLTKSLKGKGDRDLKRQLAEVNANAKEYFSNVYTESQAYDFSEAVANRLGIRDSDPTFMVTITNEPSMAIYSYPNGYVFLTGGIYEYLRNDTTMAVALLSAETAHYVLQHAYAHAKWEKSRRRKLNFLHAMVGLAVTTGGAALTANPDTEGVGNMVADIGGAMMFSKTDPRFLSDYTPQQIVEADILAYRFMQATYGSGKPYLDALRALGFYMEADPSKPFDDGITVADRIKILETLPSTPATSKK